MNDDSKQENGGITKRLLQRQPMTQAEINRKAQLLADLAHSKRESMLRGDSADAAVLPPAELQRLWRQAAIDWNDWPEFLIVRLDYAIVLSLGYDPRKVKDFAEIPEYARRFRIADSQLKTSFYSRSTSCDWYKGVSLSADESSDVELGAFGAWARGLGWELPEQFPFAELTKVVAASVERIAALPRPMTRASAQEDLILAALTEKGFDLLALPPIMSGKKSEAKEIARQALRAAGYLTTRGVVEKAWARLFADGALRYAAKPYTKAV